MRQRKTICRLHCSWRLCQVEECQLQCSATGEHYHAPAFCSAKRAPTRSECLRNLSVQFITHCSCEALVRAVIYRDAQEASPLLMTALCL